MSLDDPSVKQSIPVWSRTQCATIYVNFVETTKTHYYAKKMRDPKH